MKTYKYIARIIFVTGDIKELECDTEDSAFNLCHEYVERYQESIDYTHVRRIEK